MSIIGAKASVVSPQKTPGFWKLEGGE